MATLLRGHVLGTTTESPAHVFSVSRRVARRGECLERRLSRHCNMVTQKRDHATRADSRSTKSPGGMATLLRGHVLGTTTESPAHVFSVSRRVARRGECLERRLSRHCNMVTQKRDHATRGLLGAARDARRND